MTPTPTAEQPARLCLQYSFSLTTFSPSGKLVQIEYALAAVNAGATSLGIKATNGVVIATERKVCAASNAEHVMLHPKTSRTEFLLIHACATSLWSLDSDFRAQEVCKQHVAAGQLAVRSSAH